MPSDFTKDLDEVLDAELKEIRRRRRVAFAGQGEASKVKTSKGKVSKRSKRSPNDKPEDLVGLALSGGGLRSAIFNLGLLQAFSHRGLLRYVDYLSSVSGGGYVAGYLGARANGHAIGFVAEKNTQREQKRRQREEKKRRSGPGKRRREKERERNDATSSPGRCFHDVDASELGIEAATGRRKEDYCFADVGRYLSDKLGWLWRYLSGTILTFLLFFSCLLATSAAIALFWRSFDAPEYRERLALLGVLEWGNELLVAFLPFFGVFAIWTLAIGASLVARLGWWLGDRSLGGLALAFRGFGAGSLVTGLLGFAAWNDLLPSLGKWWLLPITLAFALFGAGFWLGRQHRRWEWPSAPLHALTAALLFSAAASLAVFLGNSETRVQTFEAEHFSLNSIATGLAVAAAIIQFLAMFGLDRFVRSDQPDASPWQKHALRLVLGVTLVLPAFAAVHWMARENISDYATRRDPDLRPYDVLDWREFLVLLGGKPSEKLPALAAAENGGGGAPTEDEITQLLSRVTILEKDQRSLYLTEGEKPGPKKAGVAEAGSTEKAAAEKGAAEPDWLVWRRKSDFFAMTGRTNLGLGLLPWPERLSEISESTLPKKQRELLDRQREVRDEQKGLLAQFNAARLGSVDLTERLMRLVEFRAKEASGEGVRTPPGESFEGVVTASFPAAGLRFAATRIAAGEAAAPDEGPAARLDAVDTSHRRKIEAWVQNRALKMREGDAFAKGWHKASLHGVHDDAESGARATDLRFSADEMRTFNRLLLEALFPDVIRERQRVSTYIVSEKDQEHRLEWLTASGTTFAVLFLLLSFNAFSPVNSFYETALRKGFIDTAARPDGHRASERLADWNTCGVGMPYHLVLGCLMLRRQVDRSGVTKVRRLPFLFSRLYCGARGPGSRKIGYRTTSTYAGGTLKPVEAITVSGSALSPYMTDNIGLTGLMTAFNLRLGRWLPHPMRRHRSYSVYQWWLSSPLLVLCETFAGWLREDSAEWSVGFVADGGFRDNLGVEELFVRRCRLIISSDAGNNGGRDQFSSLANLLRLARAEHGIEVLDLDHDRPADVERFRRDRDGRVPQQFILLRLRYPARTDERGNVVPPQEGLMLYLQMALTGHEGVEIQQIRKLFPKFPDEPTSNQFYTGEQVEAYRALGYHIGTAVCRELPNGEAGWKKLRGNSGERSPDRQPGFGAVAARLKLTYLWECRKENAFREDEVSAGALFDPADAGVGEREPDRDRDLTPDEWVREYERDADLRLFWRRRVHHLLHDAGAGRLLPLPPQGRDQTRRVPRHVRQVAGRVALLAVACREFRACESHERSESNTGEGTTDERSGGRGVDSASHVYRVGGRDRLSVLASEYAAERSHFEAYGPVGEAIAPRPDLVEPLTRLAFQIEPSVFVGCSAQTVASIVCCLVRGGERGPGATPDEPVTASQLLEFREELHGTLRRNDVAGFKRALTSWKG